MWHQCLEGPLRDGDRRLRGSSSCLAEALAVCARMVSSLGLADTESTFRGGGSTGHDA